MRGHILVALTICAVLSAGLISCGGDDDSDETTPETTTAQTDETTGEEQPTTGDQQTAAAGRQIFDQQGCGNCHTLAAADATGTSGPNLDETLPGQSEAQIRMSIVDPNAEIVEGFSRGVMPTDFGETLDDQQLSQLVSFLSRSAGG